MTLDSLASAAISGMVAGVAAVFAINEAYIPAAVTAGVSLYLAARAHKAGRELTPEEIRVNNEDAREYLINHRFARHLYLAGLIEQRKKPISSSSSDMFQVP